MSAARSQGGLIAQLLLLAALAAPLSACEFLMQLTGELTGQAFGERSGADRGPLADDDVRAAGDAAAAIGGCTAPGAQQAASDARNAASNLVAALMNWNAVTQFDDMVVATSKAASDLATQASKPIDYTYVPASGHKGFWGFLSGGFYSYPVLPMDVWTQDIPRIDQLIQQLNAILATPNFVPAGSDVRNSIEQALAAATAAKAAATGAVTQVNIAGEAADAGDDNRVRRRLAELKTDNDALVAALSQTQSSIAAAVSSLSRELVDPASAAVDSARQAAKDATKRAKDAAAQCPLFEPDNLPLGFGRTKVLPGAPYYNQDPLGSQRSGKPASPGGGSPASPGGGGGGGYCPPTGC